jgi:tetratricopeptide (TPR) repeat protein
LATLREDFLSRFLGSMLRLAFLAAAIGLGAQLSLADSSNPITLDTSETIFTVLAAMNTCGYDADLKVSDPLRATIRDEIQKVLRQSANAQETAASMCLWYDAHRTSDAAHDLSQYVSLALYLEGPPHFLPRVTEDNLPPDAAVISDFSKQLELFYSAAQIHAIWMRHRLNYAALVERYHDPLAKMVFDNDIYLKMQSGGYLGRNFTVYLDYLGDPDQVNARDYGTDYYIVVFPSPDPHSTAPLKMEEIRHAYLHYLLDPLAEKNFVAIKRVEPLLKSVQRAPIEDSFKEDISLLVTECMIRAIEIRTTGTKHTAEAMRAQAVDDAVKQGYILTRYFYEAFVKFEKDPSGLRTAYPEMIEGIDLKAEAKAAADVEFAQETAPELVQLSRMEDRRMLSTAEQRLVAGDAKGAQELAQEAIDRRIGDQGRALFILAQVAVANKNRDGAQENFQKAIQASKDPKVLAWSHVYLGRILDMKEDREAALNEYRAALSVGAALPEVKQAAERGLQQAYEPPVKPQQ